MNDQFQLFIVDDDEDDREFFCEAVEKMNHLTICRSATSGFEALQILSGQQFRPDYIFIDLNMPRMNGKQLLSHLKNDVQLHSIPVIIYSTSRSAEEREETRNLGAVHFIVKPNSIKDLIVELKLFFNRV